MNMFMLFLGLDGPLGLKGEKGSVGDWGITGLKGYRVHIYINIHILITFFF